METLELTKKEKKDQFNYRESVYFIREEMTLREEIQIYRRYLRKTVHNPYTKEEQEQFQKRINELFEILYTIVEKPRWSYYEQNRYELRHLNMAYRVIRGKDPIYPTKSEYSRKYIKEIVDRYSKDWYCDAEKEWKQKDKERSERITKRLTC